MTEGSTAPVLNCVYSFDDSIVREENTILLEVSPDPVNKIVRTGSREEVLEIIGNMTEKELLSVRIEEIEDEYI